MKDGVEFRMPSLGADMEEGTIVEWRVHPGDAVRRGDIVAVVDTDKSDIEIEVFDDATIVELLVQEGGRVPVGTPIALLSTGVGLVSPPTGATRGAEVETAPVLATTAPVLTASATAVTSPLLRHLADELHVDARSIHGTGPGGRVHRDDVIAASGVDRPTTGRRRVSPRARRLATERGIDLGAIAVLDRPVIGDDVLACRASSRHDKPSSDRMRAAIASLMTESWATIPHYHLSTRIDLTPALSWMESENETRPVAQRLIPSALLLRAIAMAAARAPSINGWWRDGRLESASTVDLGVVVSLRTGGLIVPTITDADRLTLEELMHRLSDLVGRARRGRLKSSETGPASLTVTNLGDLGVHEIHGVIHPPQVAIVGVGAIHDEPWVLDGQVLVRRVAHVTLAGDHRASDGLAGAAFLTTLERLLAAPAEL
jgi:pyruvate dehydrogenase E2 component (dihydrolipoamide acetyltransferase)